MIEARILRDSGEGDHGWSGGFRLTTFELTFPRFILAQFNTHRMIAKNSASSRAIPTSKIIESVMTNPYIPKEWGSNKKGMQAGKALSEELSCQSELAWLHLRDMAVKAARDLSEIGVHKQLVNRCLEPWLFTTVIASATEWNNFFKLRAHHDAQPEFNELATKMLELYRASVPKKLRYLDWHLPLVTDKEISDALPTPHEWLEKEKRLIAYRRLAIASAARCTRVSYVAHEKARSLEEEEAFINSLVVAGHFSGLEHTAMYTEESKFDGPFRGFRQFRKFFEGESGADFDIMEIKFEK